MDRRQAALKKGRSLLPAHFLVRIAVLLAVFVLLPGRTAVFAWEEPDVSHAATDLLPGDDAYLSLLETAERLHIEHSIDPATGVVTLSTERGRLTLLPGGRHVFTDRGAIKTLKSPPVVRKGDLVVGEEFVSLLLTLLPPSGEIEASVAGKHADGEPGKPERVDRFLRTIVIDPGHGGKDGGAVGPFGITEKDLVLQIAEEVKDLLEAKMGIRVVLTRTGDYFVPLEERTVIAADNNADLFISIHANSVRWKSISGIETYFMSVEASDDDALATANLENSVIRFEEEDIGVGGDLAAILLDMVQTEHLRDSSEFAKVLHENLSSALKSGNRGVRQAPFMVLAKAAMPAVLIEVGFLSNPAEAVTLSKKDTHKRIAEAVLKSVESYREILEARMRGMEDLKTER